jgi:hypothetical protein
MFGRSHTQITKPKGFDAGGQTLALKQQPGSGPLEIHLVPVGHCQVISTDSAL